MFKRKSCSLGNSVGLFTLQISFLDSSPLTCFPFPSFSQVRGRSLLNVMKWGWGDPSNLCIGLLSLLIFSKLQFVQPHLGMFCVLISLAAAASKANVTRSICSLPQAVHGLPTLHTVPTLLLPLTYITVANPLKLCHIIKSPCNLTNSIYSLPRIETLKQAQWLSILTTSSCITVSMGIDLFPFYMLWDWGSLGGWGLIFSVSLASPVCLSECYRILEYLLTYMKTGTTLYLSGQEEAWEIVVVVVFTCSM